nr:transient receptor potential cation channel subfamily V member 2-like isoform X1 [Zootoca vivipara]XP_034995207.1 transient receptor potential cation channel subfamily V member 2-like isoform X1 [Zootoca vivipara]XP_034995209.1 transient receptor potential cation channel subfamily V member 2-like isoform X1 [Zootoca vivipara]
MHNLPILETDDGTLDNVETREKQAVGGKGEPRPMETSYETERPPSPKIRIKIPPTLSKENTFNKSRLFGAIVRGNPKELEGLGDYLQKTGKFLTNSEYTDGETGKTCLMKALLNLKDGANPTIPLLLKIDKETKNPRPLINVACKDIFYKGHTALHVAIEARNLDLIKLLVENGADIHAKACGKFFHQQEKGACFYFGELPLSLAACTNQPEVIRYLLDNPHQKANLAEQDSLGNTVLHALVMAADDADEKNRELVIEMYNKILMHSATLNLCQKLEELTNREGLNPLTLAVKTGKIEIFKNIIHREIKDPEFRHLSRKFTEWTYGPVHISLYDLTSIDSYEENSVLDILAYSSDTPKRYKMVVLEPINKLLQSKWDSFAAMRFYISFFSYVVFMSVFSAVAYHRPLEGKPPFPVSNAAGDVLWLIGQVIVLIGGVYLLVAQTIYLWRRRLSLKSLLQDGYIEIFLLLQSVTLLVSAVMYLAGLEDYVPWMVSSLLLGWINLLYYMRGFQQTGIYIVMIHKAILRDLFHFLMVYLIFLFGFSTALVILTGEAPQPVQNGSSLINGDGKDQVKYAGLLQTSLELFKFTIGMGELEFQENLKFNYFVMLLLLFYVIMTYILLLNMLIALMSETVTKLSGYSQGVWKLQRAIAIMELEKNWLWYWQKPKRSGCQLSIGSEEEKDKRYFFRVEEVDWDNWKKELGTLKEDPTDSDHSEMASKGKRLWSWVSQGMTNMAASEAEEEQIPLRDRSQ